MRVLILSKSLGVFLGAHGGLGIWSTAEVPKPSFAVTFAGEREAINYLHTWETFLSLPDDMSFPYVEADYLHGRYASVQACVAAGAVAWTSS